MIRRSRRSLPAALVALVLLAGAVLLIWSCVQVLLGQDPLVPFAALAATGATLTGSHIAVLVAAGVVALLGLVLLAAALLPGAPTVLPLADRPGQPAAGATRRSLRGALAAAAGSVDGVDRAAVTVGGRTVTATVHTPLREAPELPEQVRTAVAERLDDIAPARPMRVRVRTHTTRSS